MKYYNAAQAARYLGISDPTIRRWLRPDKHGKIKLASFRTASGELAIAESDVERLRLEINHEREQFITPSHVSKSIVMINHDKDNRTPREDIDLESRLASMAQSIANLNATVANQTRRIGELAARVAQLEGQASLGSPRQSAPPLPTSDIIPQTKPTIRTTDTSSLPDGCVLARDFARIHSVPESSFRRHIASGIGNDRVEAGSSKHGRYLTPEQQEEALEFWIRHNVKFTRSE